jgi:hypothetical protein
VQSRAPNPLIVPVNATAKGRAAAAESRSVVLRGCGLIAVNIHASRAVVLRGSGLYAHRYNAMCKGNARCEFLGLGAIDLHPLIVPLSVGQCPPRVAREPFQVLLGVPLTPIKGLGRFLRPRVTGDPHQEVAVALQVACSGVRKVCSLGEGVCCQHISTGPISPPASNPGVGDRAGEDRRLTTTV